MQIFLYFKRMQHCNSTICDSISLSIHLWHYYVKTFNILELGWREEKRPARKGRGISNVHPIFLLVAAQLFWLLIGLYVWRTISTNCWARKFSRTWRNSLKLPSGRHNWLADRLIGIKISFMAWYNTERNDMVKLLADCHISSRIFPTFDTNFTCPKFKAGEFKYLSRH